MRTAALCLLLSACTPALTQVPPPEPPKVAPAPPAAALRDVLPPTPDGFTQGDPPTLRTREDIYEQIDGASESYLQKGLVDAAFVTWARSSEAGETLDLEVYRFEKPEGAMAQYRELNGDKGQPWHAGSTAIVDEYGVELVSGRVIVRALYSSGPADVMGAAATAAARVVLERTAGR